jgi:predicted secreted protein
MTIRREAILTGTVKAAELHAKLGLREELIAGDRPVDVLAALRELGLIVLFRPLKGLLGAYLPTAMSPGVLITTQRDMHAQRLTAAHELGHHALRHKTASLDDDVGFISREEGNRHSYTEIEADAFAFEFLLPKWLLVAHAKRHSWGKNDLASPDNVYQLSLRLGVSYSAACWALASNDLIDRDVVNRLTQIPPKVCKQRVIPDFHPETWRNDVWLLSQADGGARIVGSPNDFLVFLLEEHVAGGYVWDVGMLTANGLEIQKDEREEKDSKLIGGEIVRRVVAHGSGKRRVRLEERRPWDKDAPALNKLEFELDLYGGEKEGLPRIARPAA